MPKHSSCTCADVAVYAQGPWSHLMVGTVEQTHIYDVMWCEFDEKFGCFVVKNNCKLEDLERARCLVFVCASYSGTRLFSEG